MTTAPLFEKYYFSRSDFTTGESRFHRLLTLEIPSGARVLEIGAGPPNATSEFLSSHFHTEAVDISDTVLRNRFVRCPKVYDGRTLPYADSSFDACVSYYVMEHIADPSAHLREAARVLCAGGKYLLCTPNLQHYVAAASAVLPHWVHRKFANYLRGLTNEANEPCRTVYRANTRRAIRKAAMLARFVDCDFEMIEFEPCYGRSHPALFYPMMAYERIVNSSSIFESFRANIHVTLRKAPGAYECPAA